jgi:hypothetical protein
MSKDLDKYTERLSKVTYTDEDSEIVIYLNPEDDILDTARGLLCPGYQAGFIMEEDWDGSYRFFIHKKFVPVIPYPSYSELLGPFTYTVAYTSNMGSWIYNDKNTKEKKSLTMI